MLVMTTSRLQSVLPIGFKVPKTTDVTSNGSSLYTTRKTMFIFHQPSTRCTSVPTQTTQSLTTSTKMLSSLFSGWKSKVAYSVSIGKSTEQSCSAHGPTDKTTQRWTSRPFLVAISTQPLMALCRVETTQIATGIKPRSLITSATLMWSIYSSTRMC